MTGICRAQVAAALRAARFENGACFEWSWCEDLGVMMMMMRSNYERHQGLGISPVSSAFKIGRYGFVFRDVHMAHFLMIAHMWKCDIIIIVVILRKCGSCQTFQLNANPFKCGQVKE